MEFKVLKSAILFIDNLILKYTKYGSKKGSKISSVCNHLLPNFQYLRKKIGRTRLRLKERKKSQLGEPVGTSEQGTFFIDFRNDDDFLFGQQEIDRCIGQELS